MRNTYSFALGAGFLSLIGCSSPGTLVSLVETLEEPAGETCPAGGTKIVAGIDDNADGNLSDAEIDSTAYVCWEASGTDGAGTGGPAALVEINNIEAGDDTCPSGGYEILTGVDQDEDGQLAPEEVTVTSTLCHGEAGQSGPDGLSAIVVVQTEAAGQNCAAGGFQIQSGIDADGDGTLQAGEVNSTSYVCHGESLSSACHLIPYGQCAGEDLTGRDLRGIDLRGADLTGANLAGVDLSQAILRGAILSGADLSGATASDADLSGAVAHGTIFDSANLFGARLVGTDLLNAILTGTTLAKTDLTDALNLSSAALESSSSVMNLTTFGNLELANLDFSSRMLADAVFRDSTLQSVDFSSSYLGGATFIGTDLTSVVFSGGQFVSVTFDGVSASSVEATSVSLTGAVMKNSTFTGGAFSNCLFTNGNLSGSSFVGTTFEGTGWMNTVCPDGTLSNNNGHTCIGHLTPP